MTLIHYLDDLLILGRTPEEAISSTRLTIQRLTRLGWTIHSDKSDLVPSQKFKFLGMLLDATEMTIQPTPERTQKVLLEIARIITHRRVPVRGLAKLLGSCVSLTRFCQGVLCAAQPLLQQQPKPEVGMRGCLKTL